MNQKKFAIVESTDEITPWVVYPWIGFLVTPADLIDSDAEFAWTLYVNMNRVPSFVRIKDETTGEEVFYDEPDPEYQKCYINIPATLHEQGRHIWTFEVGALSSGEVTDSEKCSILVRVTGPTIIVSTPSDDSYTYNQEPDIPHGMEDTLPNHWWTDVDTNIYHEQRAFVKLYIGDIPQGKTIKNAVIRWGTSGGQISAVHRCYDTAWFEDEITWNNFNPICDSEPDDSKKAQYSDDFVAMDVTKSVKDAYNEGEEYVSFYFPPYLAYVPIYSKEQTIYQPLGLTIVFETEVPPPEICDWIDSKGGHTALTITDVFEIVDSFIFTTPPSGWSFVPTITEVFGIIDYFMGFNGDSATGCEYYGG